MNPPAKLPATPSAAIRMALADLEKIEKTPGYVVDMGNWHTPDYVDIKDPFNKEVACHVCFAGAVMANSLGADKSKRIHTAHWGSDWQSVFNFLDEARSGVLSVYDYPDYMETDAPELEYPCTSYSKDPEQFKADMRALAATLESLGF